MINTLKKIWIRKKNIRQTMNELNALSDKELADIGVFRSDIRQIAEENA